MDNQRFTILITLVSSVTVVFVSSATSLLSKWIDTKQRKQDRALEFNKIYATRKIEAGEAIIGRNNLLIVQARHQKDVLTAYVNNYGYYHKTGLSRIDADREKTNDLMLTDKAAYRLYFEADAHSKDVAETAAKCNRLMNQLASKLEERKLLVDSVDTKGTLIIKKENTGIWHNAQAELEELLVEFRAASDSFEASLRNSCGYFREQLRKYDIEG